MHLHLYNVYIKPLWDWDRNFDNTSGPWIHSWYRPSAATQTRAMGKPCLEKDKGHLKSAAPPLDYQGSSSTTFEIGGSMSPQMWILFAISIERSHAESDDGQTTFRESQRLPEECISTLEPPALSLYTVWESSFWYYVQFIHSNRDDRARRRPVDWRVHPVWRSTKGV